MFFFFVTKDRDRFSDDNGEQLKIKINQLPVTTSYKEKETSRDASNLRNKKKKRNKNREKKEAKRRLETLPSCSDIQMALQVFSPQSTDLDISSDYYFRY